MLCDGTSMRAISRLEVSINTVSNLLVDAGKVCAQIDDEDVRGVAAERVQVDEIWSFTYAKKKNVTGKIARSGSKARAIRGPGRVRSERRREGAGVLVRLVAAIRGAGVCVAGRPCSARRVPADS